MCYENMNIEMGLSVPYQRNVRNTVIIVYRYIYNDAYERFAEAILKEGINHRVNNFFGN